MLKVFFVWKKFRGFVDRFVGWCQISETWKSYTFLFEWIISEWMFFKETWQRLLLFYFHLLQILAVLEVFYISRLKCWQIWTFALFLYCHIKFRIISKFWKQLKQNWIQPIYFYYLWKIIFKRKKDLRNF